MRIYEHLTDAEKQGIVDLNGFKPLQDSGFKPLVSFTPPYGEHRHLVNRIS